MSVSLYCPRCQAVRETTPCPVCFLVLADRLVVDDPYSAAELTNLEKAAEARRWFEEDRPAPPPARQAFQAIPYQPRSSRRNEWTTKSPRNR